MSTDPDVTAPPAPDIEFGVQWTPALGGERIETSPIDEAHAERLVSRLAFGQGLHGVTPDAVVVYRVPGGEWSTTPPNPHGLPREAEALLQEFLRWVEENPDMPQLVDEPEHPTA